jgi:hypothetical protein
MARKRIRPDVAARAALGGGFYSRLPVPERIVCATCGEERNSIGQEDGICLKCRWTARETSRNMEQAPGAGGG